jgi:hypothetical protein
MTASVHPVHSADGPKRAIDFSGFPGGSVLSWLGAKGFVPKQDASNQRRVVYSATPSAIRAELRALIRYNT